MARLFFLSHGMSHLLICSFLGGFGLIHPRWVFLNPNPRQSLHYGACPRSPLLLAPELLQTTDGQTGTERGKDLSSNLAGVREATDTSLGRLTLYKSPRPTPAFRPKASLLSRPLPVLRDYQGDELPWPRHEVLGPPGGEGAGQPRGVSEGLLMFPLTLVWCDETSKEELFLCCPPGTAKQFLIWENLLHCTASVRLDNDAFCKQQSS